MTRKRIISRKARLWAWAQFFGFLLILIIGILTVGFIVFSNNVTRHIAPAIPPRADGIVVLTGAGGGRLKAGAQLLKDNKGERLLISGVNAQLGREDLLKLLELPQALSDCCLDFDTAADTIENAAHTGSWTQALSYEHILLVTSDYHMPRAILEISSASETLRITPYPVSTSKDKDWWRDTTQRNRLSQEYGKLLLAYIRGTNERKARQLPIISQDKSP